MNSSSTSDAEERLADELVRSDASVATAAPILRQLLVSDDQSLFSDAIVARVRGSLGHVAQQLLMTLGQAAGVAKPAEFATEHCDGLTTHFLGDTAFLGHAHALAMETVLADRMQTRAALDPIVSPLIQAMIASPDAAVAGATMNLLTAQARFGQQQRRMELPLSELPGDLFHRALQTLQSYAGPESADLANEATGTLRASYVEAESRLSLLGRCVTSMGSGAVAALSVAHAGIAVFLSALAIATGQDRTLTVLAANDRQCVRLALMLRSAGMKPALIAEQIAWLHHDQSLPDGIEQLRVDQASALLARSVPLSRSSSANA